MTVDIVSLQQENKRLLDAIRKHHSQKADDRCVFDDDELYAAAGLPPVDRRVGDKFAMAQNCLRFIERRCEGGHWPSYVELERELERLRDLIKRGYLGDTDDLIHEGEKLFGEDE